MDWHPPDWMMNAGFGALAMSALVVIIRMIGPWREQITKAEGRLRRELIAERARCEAELSLVRHRERGSRQIIYSLLNVHRIPEGERRDGALQSIRADLAELERVEAEEAAHMIATLDKLLLGLEE